MGRLNLPSTHNIRAMAYPSGYIPLGEVKPCLALGCCAASLYVSTVLDFSFFSNFHLREFTFL
jgi:hypothetical protein